MARKKDLARAPVGFSTEAALQLVPVHVVPLFWIKGPFPYGAGKG